MKGKQSVMDCLRKRLREGQAFLSASCFDSRISSKREPVKDKRLPEKGLGPKYHLKETGEQSKGVFEVEDFLYFSVLNS